MIEIKFALVHKNEIKNIFICENYELANQLARASYGNEAFAIETTRYSTDIGNVYRDGDFYKILEDNTLLKCDYIPTESENIIKLKEELIRTTNMLVLEYEYKSKLENKVFELSNIIAKLYEKMEVTQ